MIFLVVMVTGGQAKGNAPLTSVELLSTEGARLCSLPDLPKARKHHSQTGLVACAGYGDSLFIKDTLNSCVTLKSGRWQKSHTLRAVRFAHTAWASPKGVLLIGGAVGGKRGTEASEFLTDDGATTTSFINSRM